MIFYAFEKLVQMVKKNVVKEAATRRAHSRMVTRNQESKSERHAFESRGETSNFSRILPCFAPINPVTYSFHPVTYPYAASHDVDLDSLRPSAGKRSAIRAAGKQQPPAPHDEDAGSPGPTEPPPLQL